MNILENMGNGPRPESQIEATTETTETNLISEILAGIRHITSNSDHIAEGLETIKNLMPDGGHDIATQAKANAISNMISAKEQTNHQALAILEKMLDSQAPNSKLRNSGIPLDLDTILDYLPDEDRASFLRDLLIN